MSNPDLDMQQLRMLFDYTVFHIGLYLTLVTALVTVIGFGRRQNWFASSNLRQWLLVPIGCLVVAGMAGGVIAGNIPHFSGFTQFDAASIGFWGQPWVSYRWVANIEHGAFWIGVLSAIAIIVRAN